MRVTEAETGRRLMQSATASSQLLSTGSEDVFRHVFEWRGTFWTSVL